MPKDLDINMQGRSFAKQVVGAEPVKTAQSTSKILEFHISPRIWHTFSLKLRNSDLFWLSCGDSSPHNWIRNYTPVNMWINTSFYIKEGQVTPHTYLCENRRRKYYYKLGYAYRTA